MEPSADDLVRRLDRRQRRLLIGVSGLAALLLLLLAGILFYWSAYLLGPSGSPFTRGPYLLRVDAERATLRWRTDASQAVALRAVDPQGREIVGTADGVLAGLEPGVRYAWTASVDGRAAAAGSFATPPADPGAPISFVAFADYGAGGDPEWAVARVAAAQRPDFVLAPGDNSYLVADDRVLDRNIFRPLRALLADAPLFTTLGDPHDTALDGGASIVRAFDLPADGIYTVAWGPVQVVVLGTDGAAPARSRTRSGRSRRAPSRTGSSSCTTRCSQATRSCPCSARAASRSSSPATTTATSGA